MQQTALDIVRQRSQVADSFEVDPTFTQAAAKAEEVKHDDVDPAFIEQAQQYSQKREVEEKANPVRRITRGSNIVRANQREREEYEIRRASRNDAEQRWSEMFG